MPVVELMDANDTTAPLLRPWLLSVTTSPASVNETAARFDLKSSTTVLTGVARGFDWATPPTEVLLTRVNVGVAGLFIT